MEVVPMCRKKTVQFVAFFMILSVLTFMPMQHVEAKGKVKLSSTKKTLTVGQSYKIKLKNAGKVRWSTSNKKIVAIKKKGKNTVTVSAKKKGTAIITGKYKKKKYKCKITVKTKKVQDNPVLNATEVDLYDDLGEYAKYITHDENNLTEFRFRVNGTKKEVVKWEVQGEYADYFKVTDYGLVKLWDGPPRELDGVEATLVATLEDGCELKATVRAHSEVNRYIEKVFDDFAKTYITSDMTEYGKMEKCAWYIEAFYDYELYQSSDVKMIITGAGDCMASRYFMQDLARHVGLKAAACPDTDYHGITMVMADGKYYYVTTGFDEPKPRSYLINEVTVETFTEMCEKNRISMEYFGF